MKVFITGGTGFIGQYLARRMAKAGHALLCLARKTSDIRDLEKLGAHIIIGDVNDQESLRKGMRSSDWVINLANVYSMWEPDRHTFRRVNVEGTGNVMQCALETGVSKVVHVSTIGIYGKPSELPFKEDTPVGPLRFSDYNQTKYEGELIAWRLYRENKLPLVVIYPAMVLGYGDTKASGELIRRLITRRMPATVFPQTILTFVHVKDVAEIILRAAEMPDNLGEKYIAGNIRLSMAEFTALISDVAKVPLPRLRLPDSLAMLDARILTWLADMIKRPPFLGMSTDAIRLMREGFSADGSKAERELGIAYTPIRKAIEDECAWFKLLADERAARLAGLSLERDAEAVRTNASHGTWSGNERRQDSRGKVDLPCDVEGVSNGQKTSAKARVADISRQGMFIESDVPLKEGTEVNTHIIAIQFGETFWVMGKVLRSAPQGMAIRFTQNVAGEIDGILNSGRK